MAIEGPLSELAVQDVLQLLELSRKTGVLELTSDQRQHWGYIHFGRGKVVAAFKEGGEVQPLLGHLLLRDGRVTEAELDRARSLQLENPDRRIGEVLIEMGSVSREDIARALRFQIEETAFELMGWEEGYFSFRETEDVLSPPPLVEIPAGSLLMEGARRVDEWTTLEDKVPGPSSIPALSSPDAGRGPEVLDLRPEEWEILAEVDGQRDLRTIATTLGRSEFDVAKTLFGLVTAGVVEILAEPRREGDARSAREETVAEVEALLGEGRIRRARMLVDELVREHSDDARILDLFGRVLMAQGRDRAALETFLKAVELDPLSVAGHRRLGFSAVRSGELDRAIEAWSTCLRLAEEGSGDPERIAGVLDAVRALKREADREVQSLRGSTVTPRDEGGGG